MLPPADESCKSRAEARRKPEKPELGDIGAAGKQRRTRASRRIDRGVRDRDEEEVNKRQAEPDGYAGKADGRTLRGRTDDYVQKEEGGDDFDQEARHQAIFAGTEIAIAVGRKPVTSRSW